MGDEEEDEDGELDMRIKKGKGKRDETLDRSLGFFELRQLEKVD